MAAVLLVLVAVLAASLYRETSRQSIAPDVAGSVPLPVENPTRLAPNVNRSAGYAAPSRPEDLVASSQRAERQQQQQVDQAQQQLLQRYRSETTDAPWAITKERELLSLTRLEQAAQMDALPKNVDVDCKSTSCRITADFDRQGSANDWLTVFTTSLGDKLPFGVTEQKTNPDGSITIQIYGAAR